jgi:hypothetical protein
MNPREITPDPFSQQAREARANVQSLVAARLGGLETYQSEWNSLFGEVPRSLDTQAVLNLIHITDALTHVCKRLLLFATETNYEGVLTRFKDDPAGLLAFVDSAIEREYEQKP